MKKTALLILCILALIACCAEDQDHDGVLDCDPTPTPVVYPTIDPALWE